ncbi:hypothetical protein GPALN_005560 [Globodera pallida]|nr:hypothetical protein GPALN_005560 [Globodera pallida]
MHPPRVASNPPSAAAVSSRKRPTAPSIMSSRSGQSALSASSNYSYSSTNSSSSGSVEPCKKALIRQHEQQREPPQMEDITGTVDVAQQQQQQAVFQQQQQLFGNVLLSAITQQQHQQQPYKMSPQQMMIAALIEASNGLSGGGGASPFVGTLPGVPPPHPPPYNQSATPPMLQKSSVDKCSAANTNCIRDGPMPRGPMLNNNHNNTTTNANQHILPATMAFVNNVSGHNTTGQLSASFGLPFSASFELNRLLVTALQQQQSPPAAILPQGLLGCHLVPQLYSNNANGTKQSPQLNQQLCQHQSQKSNDIPPTSVGINRQTNSNITNGSSNFGNTGAIGKVSSPLETKSSKRRSSCQSQGSACIPLGNSPTQQSPPNNVNSSVKTLRGEVLRTEESARGREERNGDGKKKWGGNGTEARDVRVATSGGQRPVPRKTRRLSVDCSANVPSSSTGRAGALSSSPKDELLDMAPSASSASSSLARTKASSQQSLNDIMPATVDSQNVSPSSSQSSDSPTGTNASPMEQDGEMSTADNFQCLWQQCGEVFIKEKPFVDHVNEHVRGEQSPSFFCRWDTCKRREPFNAQYMLAQHVRKHSGEKPYQCEFLFPDGTRCKKSYSRLENKKTHERTHNGERPYQCAVCNRSFTNASDKAKHQNRTHKKTKDYHCPVMGCIKQYTDPSFAAQTRQSKEEKGSKTYGVNLIGIREDGTPYLIPQAQMPLSSSDEDREVDVMSTTPPPGSHSSRVLRASSHGEDRRGEQQQQRMTGQWLELNNSPQNGRAVTGPTGQQQQQQQQSLMTRQPKQENVASPMQNAGNSAIAEQTMLSNSTTRLQQLKMDRGAADYQTQQVQYVSGGTDHTGQQQQQQMFAFAQRQPANVARPMPPQQQQHQQHRSVVQSIGSHKHDFPLPTHPPASVVHVGPPHHRQQFFGPSHHNSPNPVLNNGPSPPAIFDFQTQQFRELDLMNSPEDPMPSNESGGYGGDGGNEVGAYGRMPVSYHSHHLRLPGGHLAYANGDGCVAAAVHDVAVHNHQHYGYQQHCQCKEYLVECQPSPPTGRCMAPPYPPPPPPAAGVNQSNVLHYSVCAYDNNKCDMTTSGCCQQTEAVQQQQRLYDSSLSLPQQQHYGGSDHGQQMLIRQQQQAQQYHQQHQTQALHLGGTITGPENAGSLQQLLHTHPNQNAAQRVVAPPSAPLSVGLLEDIELDEVSSTLSDLKMSGGGDGGTS